MDYNYVKYEVKNRIGYITISRPQALNALNDDVIAELKDVFAKVDADIEVRVAIITGEGKAFIAGADIVSMRDMPRDEGRFMSMRGQELMFMIEENSKPVIAAINGYSLGGGNELAMSCDIRIASEKAKFAQPEAGLGIIPGYGGTQRLSRLVGVSNAMMLILTGDTINAQEALRMGLVNEVVPHDQVMARAEEIAAKIIKNSPIAVKVAKSTINRGINMDIRSAIQFEAEAYNTTFSSDDRVEGMTAFTEKREAKFKDR